MKDIVILGASGHAKVIADIIYKSGDNIIGFLDDNKDLLNKKLYLDYKVFGTLKNIDKYKDSYFVIGIGNNKIREEISLKYNLKYITAIHPNAQIANDVTIDEGTVVMPGVVINPGTTIGKHCIINTSCSIDHDSVIEDFVHLSPGVHMGGTVTIKKNTWIGVGTCVKNNITINSNNVIGVGSVVVKDINDTNKVFIGNPLKELNKGN